jgi:NADH-quinone oxidoreductase subunit G
MPRIVIDEMEIEVPEGTKVIEAAERLGIMIPRFCYLKTLGSVGACRMCAVKMIKGQFKGVQMSCMIDAKDGMEVSTTDEEAVDFRRHVIEWLMMNHPHDCPVCDEGGQCLLQDMTVSGGHGIRRYLGNKRTYRDQYLGVFIAHEMDRCIHCYRCSRFYQEYAGYRDLGVMQIASHVFFGRYEDGQLESPFSGNLVDICPTGVYTDITARYRVRRWDLERAPSLCIHCSLGCGTIGNGRYREIMRVEGRMNQAVNGPFICDRGRFGFAYANHAERPRQPRVGSEESSWDQAVSAAAEGLTRVAKDSGAGAVACLGSARSSVEAQSTLKGLGKALGWRAPHYFFDQALERKVKAAVSRLDERLAVSMGEIAKADFILAVGADPVNEAPMLALAMRQAFRKGATIVVMDPRPVFLPFRFEHLPVAPGDMEARLDALVQAAMRLDSSSPSSTQPPASSGKAVGASALPAPGIDDRIASLAPKLARSRNPVLICGTEVVRETTPAFVADRVMALKGAREGAALFYVLPGASAFSGGLLASSDDDSFTDMIEGIEKGTIKALVVVESDPVFHCPDGARLEKAIEKLEFLVVMDYVHSMLARKADVLLPTCTLFEAPSTFINQEGRLQRSQAVHHGGMPNILLGGGSHPPRIYGEGVPGSGYKPAWTALMELGRALSLSEDQLPSDNPLGCIEKEYPSLASAKSGTAREMAEGIRILPAKAHGNAAPELRGAAGDGGDDADMVELLLVDLTFGTEELSSYSEHIGKVEGESVLAMHPEDAAAVGLDDGDVIAIDPDEDGPLEIKVRLAANMARGVLVLPRHHRLEWRKFGRIPRQIPLGKLRKAANRS